jgi:hypothetical protein
LDMSDERVAASANPSGAPAPAAETTSDFIAAGRLQQEPINSSELPFLVTHWLRNYSSQIDHDGNCSSAGAAGKHAALERIKKATGELASAFSSLGAFGSSTAVSTEGLPMLSFVSFVHALIFC